MKLNVQSLSVAGFVAVALIGCKQESSESKKSTFEVTAPAPIPAPGAPIVIAEGQLAAMKPPLDKTFPLTKTQNADQIALGKTLYFETRLSKNHDLSCNSCHDLNRFGVDGKPVSDGHKSQKGSRNSPTVFNAAGHFVQFWDGRSPTVETQATGPVMNPVEMAMPDEKRVVTTLESIPEYVAAFKKAFPKAKTPISLANVGEALGAFERQLATPSRWDEFLGGKADALTDDEKRGFQLFQESGCVACHNGTLVGGSSYQKAGAVKPWPNQKDLGRFEVTKNEADKLVFKVPSLRNVSETGPYFHDGSVTNLETAIQMMGEHQLGRTISAADASSIATWLKSLKGTVAPELLTAPSLPASTDKTPKPDPT